MPITPSPDTTRLDVQEILFRASRSRQALLSALQKVADAAFNTEPPGEWGAARILRHGDFEVGATLSVGIAAFPEHALNGEDLLRRADAALYSAKGSGRNRSTLAAAILD